jgi:hypothetical protein
MMMLRLNEAPLRRDDRRQIDRHHRHHDRRIIPRIADQRDYRAIDLSPGCELFRK